MSRRARTRRDKRAPQPDFDDDTAAYVRQLEHGSFTTTWPRLVRDVGTGECMCTTAELLDMAAACMQRLQQRGGPARLAA